MRSGEEEKKRRGIVNGMSIDGDASSQYHTNGVTMSKSRVSLSISQSLQASAPPSSPSPPKEK